eukprot:TRINITY_DN4822_c0_g3_i1.p1 TRINITY_DN4822_c0_g3~~TRINITY_DN4822_c0_g3_i1.p1  ORF type:complete len:156 (-),score=50.26 TRINITY_DN4822_c0_g3_i1:114-581(-)
MNWKAEKREQFKEFQVSAREEVLSQSGSRDDFLKKLQEENKELERQLRTKTSTPNKPPATKITEDQIYGKSQTVELVKNEADLSKQVENGRQRENKVMNLEMRLKEAEEIARELRDEVYRKSVENRRLLEENDRVKAELSDQREENESLKRRNKE